MSLDQARAQAEDVLARINDPMVARRATPLEYVSAIQSLLAALPEIPTTDEALVRDTLIEGVKLSARNLMRNDPRVWHEALESALDKTLPEFWAAAAGCRRPSPPTEEQVEAALAVMVRGRHVPAWWSSTRFARSILEAAARVGGEE